MYTPSPTHWQLQEVWVKWEKHTLYRGWVTPTFFFTCGDAPYQVHGALASDHTAMSETLLVSSNFSSIRFIIPKISLKWLLSIRRSLSSSHKHKIMYTTQHNNTVWPEILSQWLSASSYRQQYNQLMTQDSPHRIAILICKIFFSLAEHLHTCSSSDECMTNVRHVNTTT